MLKPKMMMSGAIEQYIVQQYEQQAIRRRHLEAEMIDSLIANGGKWTVSLMAISKQKPVRRSLIVPVGRRRAVYVIREYGEVRYVGFALYGATNAIKQYMHGAGSPGIGAYLKGDLKWVKRFDVEIYPVSSRVDGMKKAASLTAELQPRIPEKPQKKLPVT